MKLLCVLLLMCIVGACLAEPFYPYYGRFRGGRRPHTNIARQHSQSISGDGGTSISSGSARAGDSHRSGFGFRGKRELNVAEQKSEATGGEHSGAKATGSAEAIGKGVQVNQPNVNVAKQSSIATVKSGIAESSGSSRASS